MASIGASGPTAKKRSTKASGVIGDNAQNIRLSERAYSSLLEFDNFRIWPGLPTQVGGQGLLEQFPAVLRYQRHFGLAVEHGFQLENFKHQIPDLLVLEDFM
jgi:hypothetical protein